MDLISALTCITLNKQRGTIRTNMKESATMTAQAETVKKKSTQVSTTLTPETYERLEDYRWSNRINKVSDIVAEAVDAFLDSKGVAKAPAAAEVKPAK